MLSICVYGHPVLRKKANEVAAVDDQLQLFIDELFETMYKAEGVGLAAPQVGRSLRVFVIDTQGFKESYPETELVKETFINPEIVETLGVESTFNEGCLSLPEVREDIIRKSEVILNYLNREGKRKNEHFKGLAARVILHEIDHLDGHVFTDHVSSIRKMIIKKKLNDIASGKTKPKYKSNLH
jgi:peptide deformylase